MAEDITLQPNIPSVNWKVIEERPFDAEEIDAVSQAIVVASQYGNSVRFIEHVRAHNVEHVYKVARVKLTDGTFTNTMEHPL